MKSAKAANTSPQTPDEFRNSCARFPVVGEAMGAKSPTPIVEASQLVAVFAVRADRVRNWTQQEATRGSGKTPGGRQHPHGVTQAVGQAICG